ncbi:HNH endonuclease signature motif containing protein [Nocardioides pakistanensis]
MESVATPVTERMNPIHGFAGRALAALDAVAGAPGWAMAPGEQAETLVELATLAARVEELRLRVLAAADRDDIGAAEGAASTAAWLASRTRAVRSRCNADLRLARVLDEPRFAPTREALAAGRLDLDQVWVIVRAVEDLPADEVTDEQRLAAQAHLVDLAALHDAKALRVLAKRLFEVLAPDEADRREGEALEREEARAREKTRFSMRDNGDGTYSGLFKLPTLQAQMLAKAVQAFAAPRRNGAGAHLDPDGNKVPYPVLLGRAFAELCEHLPVDRLPQAGGVAATVVVTSELEVLRTGVGSAVLDTGERISAGEVRRMACTAGIIPAVLGSDSVPLDLGRTVRLHTPQQRIAMGLRDGGCSTQGCDRPPGWCEAHHDEETWAEGGGTSVDKGRLLCPHHHRLAHDHRYDMRRLPDGKVRFHQRT